MSLVVSDDVLFLLQIIKDERNDSRNHSKRHPFTKAEDKCLCLLHSFNPHASWKDIASVMINRTGRQCREHYLTYLAPDVNTSELTTEEASLLFELVSTYGKRWSYLQNFFPGRSSNNLKNYYNIKNKKNGKEHSFSFLDPHTFSSFVLETETIV